MQLRRLALPLLAALFLFACDDGGDGNANDATDTLSSDVADDATTDDTVTADTAEGGFACGATLSCLDDEACASRGQGACIGDPPDENGHCPANCSAYECGGGPTCLCDTYWCVDLPSGCDSCDCAEAPDASCECDDSSGHVVFGCMGA